MMFTDHVISVDENINALEDQIEQQTTATCMYLRDSFPAQSRKRFNFKPFFVIAQQLIII